MLNPLVLIGTLSILLTLIPTKSAAGEFKEIGKIVCSETKPSDDGTTIAVGTVTITLGPTKSATKVVISRKGIDALPAINKTFSIQSSTITHEVVKAPESEFAASRIETLETISVVDGSGRKLKININEHRNEGDFGSTLFYEDRKIIISSDEEGNLFSCEGEFRLPLKNATS